MYIADPIPLPPLGLLDEQEPTFLPSLELEIWVRDHFIIDADDPFYNVDHKHLEDATLGFLWASIDCTRKGSKIAGCCGLGQPQGGDAWSSGQKAQQVRGWFGGVPDFVITFDAQWFLDADDASRLSCIDHELYHASIALDKDGNERFDRFSGAPIWGMKPHDVEQFVGVVERWGVMAAGQKMAQLAHAIKAGPTIAMASIEGVCGTCGRRVA